MTFILTFVEIRFAQICEDPGFQARPQPFLVWIRIILHRFWRAFG